MNNKTRFVGDRVKVAELFDLQMGKTPSRKNLDYWNNGDYEWVSIKDLGSYGKYVGSTKETISELGRIESGIKPAPANTLIMSFKLSLGKTAITTKETYTNEAIVAFLDRGKYEFDLDFMWHQFRAKDWSAGTNTAVMGKTLNKKTLGQATLVVPPIAVQKRISDELDAVLRLISLSNNQLKSFNQLVKSRFVEMFGDPISDPLFEKKAIGVLAIVSSGATPSRKKPEYYEGTIPWVKTGEVAAGEINSTEEHITQDAIDRSACHILPRGTVLVAMYGQGDTRGKSALLNIEAATNQACAALEFDESVIPSFALAQLQLCYDDLRSLSHGGNQKNLSLQIIKGYQLEIPPLPLQQEFADFVAQVDKSRFAAQQQIEKLQMLYDSLAQDYFG